MSANGKGFLQGLGWWFALAIPSTYTNSMIRFLERKLALAFRTNLTRYIHDLYLCVDQIHRGKTLMDRNDKLNYYKFGLGLGAVSGPISVDQGKKRMIEMGAAEAAAGTADQ